MDMVDDTTRWEIDVDDANPQVHMAIMLRSGTILEGKDELMKLFAATPPKKDNKRTEKKLLYCKLNMCEFRYEEDFGLGLGPTTNHIQMYWFPREDKLRAVLQKVTSHSHGNGVTMHMVARAEREAESKKLTKVPKKKHPKVTIPMHFAIGDIGGYESMPAGWRLASFDILHKYWTRFRTYYNYVGGLRVLESFSAQEGSCWIQT